MHLAPADDKKKKNNRKELKDYLKEQQNSTSVSLTPEE